MRKILTVLAVLSLAVLVASCAGTSVKRVTADTITDLSGRWNDTDSQLVAEKIVDDMLNGKWLRKYLKNKGREPKVIVGTVKNKTDEHISVSTFIKDIENAITNSGDVQFVASKEDRQEIREERTDMQEYASDATMKKFKKEIAADFMLKGELTSIPDRKGGKKAVYYQFDAELFDTETNIKVWVGQKKIKKNIDRPGLGF